jgi:hypothetical protein
MKRSRTYASLLVTFAALMIGATAAHATATPVGPLPSGPISSTTTKAGQMVAIALPHTRRSAGYTWRIARRYDANIVKQVSEADIGTNVVLVFRVVGRGDTSIAFGLTRGDASPKAVQSYTYKIHASR